MAGASLPSQASEEAVADALAAGEERCPAVTVAGRRGLPREPAAEVFAAGRR